jgi:hypothetical protein
MAAQWLVNGLYCFLHSGVVGKEVVDCLGFVHVVPVRPPLPRPESLSESAVNGASEGAIQKDVHGNHEARVGRSRWAR